MSAIKKLLIINFLLFNSTQMFTMSRSLSHKQDQQPASVDVHINNKLPHNAIIRAKYTGNENKKNYEDKTALPGRSSLKISVSIQNIRERELLNLSAIESIDPKTNTLVSRIPEWQIPGSSSFMITIDPEDSLSEPLSPTAKKQRLTTIPEEASENDHYTREEVLQGFCPNCPTSNGTKKPVTSVIPTDLEKDLEAFLH